MAVTAAGGDSAGPEASGIVGALPWGWHISSWSQTPLLFCVQRAAGMRSSLALEFGVLIK